MPSTLGAASTPGGLPDETAPGALLVYRIPRKPSRHRVAVWRKLRTSEPSTCTTG
jgi:hypothetical protein